MKNKGLQATLLMIGILSLAGLLSLILIVSFAISSLKQAMKDREQIGFVVSSQAVVYRTPNSELFAPAWNEPVPLADPATFKTVYHSQDFCFGADATNVFMGEGRRVYLLNKAQPSTFRLLTPDGRYACDAARVYYLGFELPQADPASFEILGEFTAKDARQVYVGPKVLKLADPETFQLDSEGQLPTPTCRYSEGPCTLRKFQDDALSVTGFLGHDKNGRLTASSDRPGRR